MKKLPWVLRSQVSLPSTRLLTPPSISHKTKPYKALVTPRDRLYPRPHRHSDPLSYSQNSIADSRAVGSIRHTPEEAYQARPGGKETISLPATAVSTVTCRYSSHQSSSPSICSKMCTALCPSSQEIVPAADVSGGKGHRGCSLPSQNISCESRTVESLEE